MKTQLYTYYGIPLFEVAVDESSSQDWSLMSDNKLSISFELEECVVLTAGCYIDFDSTRFYLLNEYKPTMICSSVWKYDLTLGDAASWLSITLALKTIDDENTPLFKYTAPAAEHAAIIVANLNRRMDTDQWKVGSVISTENIAIDYSGKYCSDVLQEIVDAKNTEWWIEGMTLNIGPAEFGESVTLGYMNGVLGDIVCDTAGDMRSYAYLFPIGSTRNIDPTKYGHDRLQLPSGLKSVPINPEQGVAELVEEAAFAHIYPRYEGTVSAVRYTTAKNEDGTSFLIYYIKDTAIPFNPNEFEIPGLVKHITFQSGELMGQEFEVNYSADSNEFELITRWTGDIQLPGGVLVPAVGDKYVVWNISMPDVYYTIASHELLDAARAYAADAIKDVSVYKVKLDYIDVQERGLKLRPGQRVRLQSDEYFASGYYDSRITRITRNIAYPDELSVDISAVRMVGTLSRLQASIQKTENVVAQFSGQLPAIIKSNDDTSANDSSVYTSAKSEKEFLNKRKGGRVAAPVTFDEVAEFLEGLVAHKYIKVGNGYLKYNDDLGVWEMVGDLLVTGAVTMFGSLSGFKPSTIMDGVLVDGETIVKTKNSQGQWQLTAIGGGSGTGGGISAAEVNILIENALKPYALSTSIPTDNKQLSNGAGYATVGDLDTRINNLINGAPAAYDTLKEIADVLAGNVNSIGDILTALDTKAAKTYVEAELTKYVKLATAQTISARHNFSDGLQIGGLPISKSASANNTIYLDANLVVSGAITMFGSGSTTFPTIWANIPFNLEHMSWDGSQWNVIVEGGSGSGSLDTNAVNVLISDYLTQKSYATISDISSALVGYATQSWVGDKYLSKSGGTVNGSITANTLNTQSSIWASKSDGYGVTLYGTADEAVIGVHTNGNWKCPNLSLFANSNVTVHGNLLVNGGITGNLTGNATNADMLDNYHASDFVKNYGNNLPVDANNVVGYGQQHEGWLYYGPVITFGLDYYKLQLQSQYDNPTISVRTYYKDGGGFSDWKTIAFIDSNVDSATKLQKLRTIWGQSFDGTQDLNKSLIIGNTQSSLLAAWQEYIGICATGTGLSGWMAEFGNGTKGILLGCRGSNLDIPSIGTVNATDIAIGPDGGNVAIGGTTADAKLHIHGTNAVSDAYASGLLIVGESNGTHLAIDGNDIQAKSNANTLSTLYLNGWGGDVIINESNAGKVGIGTTNPTVKFHIHYSNGTNGMTISRDGDECSIGYVSTANSAFVAGVWGNSFNIWNENHGTIASFNDGGATINGNLLTTGVITMFSQLSMKNVIDYDGLSLAQLAQIRPARFTWKDGRDNRTHVGCIADEVMRVLPEVVHRTKDDKLTMDYGSAGFFIATSLIKPVIDHEQRLQSAEKEIKDLKAENKRLREQLRAS